MRPAVLLSAVLVAGLASAQDAKIQFLSKQLSSGGDPRTRAQAALLLGKSGNALAVAPLCSALKDGEAVVRSAAVGALAELTFPDALPCLKAANREPDATVRAAIARALDALAPKSGGLYIAVEPVNDKVGSMSADVLALAESLIREKVSGIGATLAPTGETRAAANAIISRNGMKGFLLRANLLPNDERGLKLEILIMTYPDLALQGSWNVKAKGAKPETLLKVMVPRVVDDAANELEWKQ